MPLERDVHAEGAARHRGSKAALKSGVRRDDWQDKVNNEAGNNDWRCMPKSSVLEIFAGCCRLTNTLRKQGIDAFAVDICLDKRDDVLSRKVQLEIINLIRHGFVALIWIGMPCTTFSRARKNDGLGPGPLRSDECPMGLPLLNCRDCKKVDEGNHLLAFSCRLIHEAQVKGIPWILENPNSSRAWLTPSLQQVIGQKFVETCVLDFCQFGTPWKKPTALLHERIDLSRVARTCKHAQYKCSRSGKAHVQLLGVDNHGIFMTLRAQPYPYELCEVLAQLIASSESG